MLGSPNRTLSSALVSIAIHSAALGFVLWRHSPGDHRNALVEIHLENARIVGSGKKHIETQRPAAGIRAAGVDAENPDSAPQGDGEIASPDSEIASWIIGPEKPAYPPISRRRGEEGELVVSVEIHPAGSVLKAELIRSSGFPRLDQAGLDYLNTIRFGFARLPATPVTKRFSLVFSLKN